MKKLLAFLLAFVLLSCQTAVAFADGELTVSDKTIIEFEADDTAYFFAKIENTGDKAIGVGNGKLVAFSADDDILATEDYISSLPYRILLEPGEYAYVSEYIWENALEDDDIADYKFSIKESSDPYMKKTFACEAVYEDAGRYDRYICVTFTNDTEEILFDAYIVAALYDTDGNLIFADCSSEDGLGIHPGSTVTIKLYVSNDLAEYYAGHGIEIGTVDALVYQIEE